jgi:hypothetical protein
MPLVSRILPFLLGVCAALPAATRVQDSPQLAGRYDFRSVTLEGDSFQGTVHLIGGPEGYGGRVLTTVQRPMPVSEVRVSGAGQARGPEQANDRVEEPSLQGKGCPRTRLCLTTCWSWRRPSTLVSAPALHVPGTRATAPQALPLALRR